MVNVSGSVVVLVGGAVGNVSGSVVLVGIVWQPV